MDRKLEDLAREAMELSPDARAALAKRPDMPVVVMTGFGTVEHAVAYLGVLVTVSSIGAGANGAWASWLTRRALITVLSEGRLQASKICVQR